tara:strand:+ start:461 stop:715 length:255 start_codon:yes stop_codon:yes gene_type:complete
MTKYVKKIYAENEKYFILASKTKEAGHHIIDLDHNLNFLRIRIVNKKIKLSTISETESSAKIEKTKKNGKLHYNVLKIYKNLKT